MLCNTHKGLHRYLGTTMIFGRIVYKVESKFSLIPPEVDFCRFEKQPKKAFFARLTLRFLYIAVVDKIRFNG